MVRSHGSGLIVFFVITHLNTAVCMHVFADALAMRGPAPHEHDKGFQSRGVKECRAFEDCCTVIALTDAL